MKKIIAICISCFVFLTTITAQMDRSIAPKTSTLPADLFGKVNQIVLPPFTAQDSAKFDFTDSRDGHAPAMSVNIAVKINLSTGGSWTILPNNDRVWRVIIIGDGAQALAPIFDQLYLPPGASLHFYMPGKEEILGAFTNEITSQVRAFCPGLVHGATCVVEYYEPASQLGKGLLSINRVGYAYRYIAPLPNDLKSGSGSCEVNVICPEGDNWRDQIRSVVKILIIGDTVNAFCSGAMVNNVRKDCTPYVLSAGHCIDHVSLPSDYSAWTFYFNYQSTTCSDPNGQTTDVVNGCRQIAYSNDDDGHSGSDFEFVELDHAPPSAFNAYYSGWDITNTPSPSGVGIHHPGGDIKKISTYTTTTTSTNVGGGIAHDTHWQVFWAPTADGDGVTEPGSSGSPLYNSNGLIIGHLTGGLSCCTLGGCTNAIGPNSPDIYGKIAYDWTSDGATPSLQLKPWLDPDNTGATTLQGMNPPCSVAQQNDAGLESIPEPAGNICTPTVTPFLVLRNYGANALTTATISYKYDNGSFSTYNWTGNLGAGLSVIVQLPAATISAGAHTFTAIVNLPNGQTNTNTANTSLTSTFFVSSPGGNLLLALTTDSVGTKTTWQITDPANNVVASGGPYPDIVGGYTYNIPLCLPAACYKFSIFSSAGDGMTDGGTGNFTLTSQVTGNILANLENPAFGASEIDNFCVVASTGINQIAAFSFSIIPNPSTGQFNINVETADEKTVQVFDITGQLILERKTSDQNFMVDLGNQSKGIYILQIETANGKAVQKLVLK